MPQNKVIFHIDELKNWKLLLNNVNNLIPLLRKEEYDIEVLANGEAVKYYVMDHIPKENLEKNQDVDKSTNFEIKKEYIQGNKEKESCKVTMERLYKEGVKFVACNNSLNGYEIKQEELLSYINVVPSGVYELVLKQQKGYAYIKP
jgi:intracellular sulfur oxidation DsrE/DsrF family protein